MCLLIVLAGLDGPFRIVAASNRDEQRDRKAAPPGLYVGARHRMLSPRDRRAGGTWLAVSERGWLAGLTNFASVRPHAAAASRGELPHLALDADRIDAAAATVVEAVSAQSYGDFQLVICDGERTVVVRQVAGAVTVVDRADRVTIVTNEHPPGALDLADADAAAAPGLTLAERFALLQPILLRDGSDGGHRILKRGEHYGTVSSSLIAVPREDPRQLIWRYAAGAPDVAPYREYGNLGRRLEG
jgi:uncharacterized protein with NRDE domain